MKDGKPTGEKKLPMEAMVLSVMSKAAKGDLAAISFIRSLTEQQQSTDTREEDEQRLKAATDEIKTLMKAQGLEASTPEAELLAVQLLTLRRIARMLLPDNHRDVLTVAQPSGKDKQELSTDCRIYNDLAKQFRQDLADLRQSLVNREMQRKMMRRS